MNKRARHESDLSRLFDELAASGDSEKLVGYLVSNSGIPGRRANLELARAFGDVVEGSAATKGRAHWQLCQTLLGITAKEAPENDPREFVPFCGAVGIGAIGAAALERFDEALSILRTQANDPRWRMREAVRFGLQRLLAKRCRDSLTALRTWIADGRPLEIRAAAAAVADPVLLEEREAAEAALELQRALFERVLGSEDRRSEEFKTLRKALGYTLSVVVQALPDAGFGFMAQLVASQDRDVVWMVKQNLKKRRLVKHFPEQVASIERLLGDG